MFDIRDTFGQQSQRTARRLQRRREQVVGILKLASEDSIHARNALRGEILSPFKQLTDVAFLLLRQHPNRRRRRRDLVLGRCQGSQHLRGVVRSSLRPMTGGYTQRRASDARERSCVELVEDASRSLSLAHSNETTVVGSVFEVRIADCKQTDERQTTLFDARLDARRALGQTDGLRGRSGGDRRCPVVERSGHRSRARARRVLERAPRATRARARSTDVRQVSAGGPENGGDRAGRRRVDVSTESSARMTSSER